MVRAAQGFLLPSVELALQFDPVPLGRDHDQAQREYPEAPTRDLEVSLWLPSLLNLIHLETQLLSSPHELIRILRYKPELFQL